MVGGKGAADFFDSDACGGDIFAGVLVDVEGLNETEEMVVSFVVVCDHPVDNEAEERDGALMVRG